MLKQLKSHHREIARLSFQGFKPAEIAERLAITPVTVRNILKDPLAQGYIGGLQDQADVDLIDVRREMVRLNPLAIDTLRSMVDEESIGSVPAAVRLSAAKDILDRNGYKAPERHEHVVGHFTAEDIKSLRSVADSVDTSYLVNQSSLEPING